MYHMVDNLVNFIKPEMHGTSTSVMQVKLQDAVNEKVALFKPVLGASNGTIQVRIPPNETVITDRNLLTIIIHNLIDNAIKAHDGNSIHIYTEHLAGQLHLVFQDNGPGMPAELLQWLNASDERNTSLPAGYQGRG